jgi:hypothetical protein
MTSWINIHALLHGLFLDRSFVPRANEKVPSSMKYCYLFFILFKHYTLDTPASASARTS